MYTKNLSTKIDSQLLAAHIADNKDFESACKIGDANQIRAIIATEMENNKLFTAGSKKLQTDILALLQGKTMVTASVGQRVLWLVWSSRMAGNGLKVI